MPITQPRMLELLAAAQDYKRALEQVCEFTERQRAAVSAGRVSQSDAYDLIANTVRPEFLLSKPLDSAMTIILEAKHFAQSGRRNIRKATKLRENREAARAGLQAPIRATTAPRSILAAPKPPASLLEQVGAVKDSGPKWTGGFATESETLGAEDELVLDDSTDEDDAPVSKPERPGKLSPAQVDAMIKFDEQQQAVIASNKLKKDG